LATSPRESAPATKPCCVCAEPIRLNARKCVECQSYQDWRRFTDLVPAPLPWIAALATTLVAMWPLVQAAFHEPDSDLVFSVPRASISSVSFFVNNRGDRPAVLENLRLNGREGDSLLMLTSHSGGSVIGAGESKFIELPLHAFEGDQSLFERYASDVNGGDFDCRATYSYEGFRDGSRKDEKRISCQLLNTASAASAVKHMNGQKPPAGALAIVFCDPNCMQIGPRKRPFVTAGQAPSSPEDESGKVPGPP